MAFSKAELSKSFRQLAFALHPDYNKHADAHSLYRSLHENKEILIQLFQA
jgi:DnaJ-class molecular chaperone